jgi:hypothetical protein
MDDPSEQDDDGSAGYTVLSDPEEVRRWADANDVVPVKCEDAPGPRATELRNGEDLRDRHETRDWDAVLREFEDRNLAVVHERGGAPGDCRLVDHDTVATDRENDADATGATDATDATGGGTVEEATVESVLVGSEVVEREVVEREVLDRELVGVAVEGRTNVPADGDRDPPSGAGSAGGGRECLDEDGHAMGLETRDVIGLDIDETRLETEERFEKHVVESWLAESDPNREGTVRHERADMDAIVGRIHEHIRRSDVVDVRSDQVLEDRHIETEFGEGNGATSVVVEHRTVESEVVERKVVYAGVADVEVEESDRVCEEVLETGILEADRHVHGASTGRPGGGTAGTPPVGDVPVVEGAPEPDGGVGDYLIGREVERPDGETIGIVSDVDEDRNVLYVDEDPSLTDRIRASLQWGDEHDASALAFDRVREIRADAVVVEWD